MTVLRAIGDTLQAWIQTVALAIVVLLGRIAAPAIVRLIEQEDGRYRLDTAGHGGRTDLVEQIDAPQVAAAVSGRRVEIVLQGRRFLFRQLDLPPRAADFLDGIVRAQIDRLTPWTAAEAVFGHSAPVEKPDGIITHVAATTRKAVAGIIEAVSEARPAAIALLADGGEHSAGRIRVFEQATRGRLDPQRLGTGLQAALAIAAVAAIVSVAAALYYADRLGAREDELNLQIAQRRAALRMASDGAARSPLAALERQKHESPASVIVLEALSRILPDHTYLTELHVAGARMQIAGITRDAPSLIPLIEQSGHFTRATFYAPTTRSATDPGERFHIEAQIEPRHTVAP